MKIGIVGAGFTGLSAGYYLSKLGHEVYLLEKGKEPGGLAIGYKEPKWEWTLEEHYHHWFTNDKNVLNLAAEIGHNVLSPRPKTSSFVNGNIYQLDSPASLLKFPLLSLPERVRMGASLAALRYNPVWKPLEKFKADSYLKKTMGLKAFKQIWEPLLKNKLGKFDRDVSLAWFWARVYKRTSNLAYPEGGFLSFAKHIEDEIKNQGGKFYFDTEVLELTSEEKPKLTFKEGAKERKTMEFDSVIVTTPTFLFLRIAKGLPEDYTKNLGKLKGIGAMNMVLRLKNQFLIDGTYWLNMCDLKSPILAIVEHTNFMPKEHYNNEHILYLGNYMETSDSRFSMSDKELLKLYDPWLKKLNPDYKSSIIDFRVFKAPFAQPLIPVNYSKFVPKIKTPLKNVYLANIEQVYPWDRGTNYAVELGEKVSKLVLRNA